MFAKDYFGNTTCADFERTVVCPGATHTDATVTNSLVDRESVVGSRTVIQSEEADAEPVDREGLAADD